MSMNRRRFLIGGIVGITGLVAGGWAIRSGFFYQPQRVKNTIWVVFHKRLNYLKWNQEEVERFIEDFIADVSDGYLAKIQKLSYVHPLYAYTGLLEMSPIAGKLKSFEERITTHFLMSTDLFYGKPDVSQPVKYLGLYDPHKTPCRNPFSEWWY